MLFQSTIGKTALMIENEAISFARRTPSRVEDGPGCGPGSNGLRRSGTDGSQTRRWREQDSNLYGAFPVKSCFLVCCRFFVRSGKAVLRPVACNQVRRARGRGQGTETVAKLGGLPPQRGLCFAAPRRLSTRSDDELRDGAFRI